MCELTLATLVCVCDRFKTSNNDHVVEVNLYDDIDFVCPHVPARNATDSSAYEYYLIHQVSTCVIATKCAKSI